MCNERTGLLRGEKEWPDALRRRAGRSCRLIIQTEPVPKRLASVSVQEADGEGELPAIVRASAEVLSKFIVPLYLDDASGRPSSFGTGFFVQHGNGVFLVSAAHVLDEAVRTKAMYFYVRPAEKRFLSGKVRRIAFQGSRSNDRYDVGVVRLDPPHPPFAEVDKFAMRLSYLRPFYLPRSAKEYLIIGFPASRATLRLAERQLIAEPYSLWSPSIPETSYAAHGLTPDRHVIIPFRRKRVFSLAGQRIHGPSPQGMSGAPVFVLFEHDEPRDRTFSVVAASSSTASSPSLFSSARTSRA